MDKRGILRKVKCPECNNIWNRFSKKEFGTCTCCFKRVKFKELSG